MTIDQATQPDDIAIVRELLREYERALGVDLCFQGFAQELANLPGDYAPPRGTLLLARDGDAVAGCIALRPVDDRDCEMKRLYVRDAFRATGLGRRLVERVIVVAHAIGYRRMVLDTLPTMIAAQRLYETFGFTDITAYRPNPIQGTRYLGLVLDPIAAR
ncbi:GNAT family N-acetyltransferase [Rudaea sp.]|uniref:GNAT family N-acetyltransferase n=1 Tax=Rudaea sp. TaxID=2136325 RepID=UPI002ED2A33D